MPLASRGALLAFDRAYDEAGEVDLEHTEFHVPNEWAWEVAQRSPEHFVPVMSVHPYRDDAVPELERWAERSGASVVKQREGADPASVVFDALGAARARGRNASFRVEILVRVRPGRVR